MPQQLQMSRSRPWTLCSSTCECQDLSGDDSGSLVRLDTDTLSQGYTNLQSLVNSLDHGGIASDDSG